MISIRFKLYFQRRRRLSECCLRITDTFVSTTPRKHLPYWQQCRDPDWSLILCGLSGHQDSRLVTRETFPSSDQLPGKENRKVWRVQHVPVLQRGCPVPLQRELSRLGFWAVTHFHLQKSLSEKRSSFSTARASSCSWKSRLGPCYCHACHSWRDARWNPRRIGPCCVNTGCFNIWSFNTCHIHTRRFHSRRFSFFYHDRSSLSSYFPCSKTGGPLCGSSREGSVKSFDGDTGATAKIEGLEKGNGIMYCDIHGLHLQKMLKHISSSYWNQSQL